MYYQGTAVEDLIAPADEAETRGYVFGFLQLLNSVSSECGLSGYHGQLVLHDMPGICLHNQPWRCACQSRASVGGVHADWN